MTLGRGEEDARFETVSERLEVPSSSTVGKVPLFDQREVHLGTQGRTVQTASSPGGMENKHPILKPTKSTADRNSLTSMPVASTGPEDESGKVRALARHFTTAGTHPFDQIEWDHREVAITDDTGKIIFKQSGVEFPKFWSQTASNVVASKYFRGGKNSQERESSVKGLITRVADTITAWGSKDRYFSTASEAEIFNHELSHILVNQYAAFNSPVWFNVGVQDNPQCSACFIVSIDDSLDSLLEAQTIEGRLFKFGSGTGSNLSKIRSSKERLSGGGIPSGPVSFMRGYDAWAGIIKSGGKTRRAAKMQILNIDHPDIKEFITCKSSEEKKAWALIEQGYDGGFSVPGGAYDSVSFQNANLSVRVTDQFMQAVVNDSSFNTLAVTDQSVIESHKARELLKLIAEGTHICGDPGMQFDTIINDWHTCPNSGRINSSNPCSEYMHLDNSACNLASINLLKYFDEEGSFNVDAFQHTVDILITAQDILIDNSSYPTEKIGECARKFRQLGLGYANLGATLMCLGVPYESEKAHQWTGVITAIMTGQAYKTSALLAQRRGAFQGFEINRDPMLKVIEKHYSATEKLQGDQVPEKLLEKSRRIWLEALNLGEKFGYRNSQTTVLAPTGTISFMMDCDTTGIEPDIALVKYKKLAGGGMLKLVNHSVVRALRKLGYSENQRIAIVEYIDQHGTIEGAPGLKPEDLAVFDCAFKPTNGSRCVSYMGHLQMMAAAQPFISGAISKTVNLPKEATVDEIFQIYLKAWQLGIKAVALYRDGSKRTQPVSADKDLPKVAVAQPTRRRLPDERSAITHKFTVGGLEGYLTVGLYEDGQPGEIFLVVAKEGSTLSGVMDAFATSISIALQYGVPLTTLVKKFAHMRFEPAGFTHNKDIPLAKSVVDYVFRWLAHKFLSNQEKELLGLKVPTDHNGSNGKTKSPIASHSAEIKDLSSSENGSAKKNSNGIVNEGSSPAELLSNGHQLITSTFQNSEDAPPCTSCGSSLMVRQAGCYVCLNCGAQGGCG